MIRGAPLRYLASLAASALVAGMLATAGLATTAGPAAAQPACTFNGVASGGDVGTVVPGTTTISVSCTGLAASTTFAIADASTLAGVLTSPSTTNELNLVMGGLGGVSLVSSSASGDLSATFTVPSATVAANTDGVCPPTQAQVDAGLTNCAVAVANFSTGVSQGDVLLNYPGQVTPNAPTLSLSPTTGPTGTTVTASGSNWWADGVSTVSIPASDITVGGVAATSSSLSVPAATYTPGTGTNGSGGTLTGGTITGTFAIPSGAPSGSQSVVVTEPNPQPPGNPPYTGATISGTASFDVSAAPMAPTITSAASTTFTVGSPGSFTVTTTGNPIPSISETGSLPSGVTFVDNGDGTATLSGTPASGTQGTYPLTITASNGVPPDATQNFTLTVVPSVPAGTITVSPDFNPTTGAPLLIGNKAVTVKGTGFVPGEMVTVQQYGASGTPDTSNTTTATASSKGTIKASLTVAAGVVNGAGDQCGTVLSGSTSCYVQATGATSGATNKVTLGFKIPTISVAGLTMPSGNPSIPYQIPKVTSTNVTLTAVGNRVVKLIAKNFPIGDSVGIAQCDNDVLSTQSQSNCDTSTAVVGTANTGGTVQVSGATPTFSLEEGTKYDASGSPPGTDPAGGSCTPPGDTFCVMAASDVSNPTVANAAQFQWAVPTLTLNTTTFPDTNGKKGPTTATFKATGMPIGDSIVGLECETALLSNLGSPSAEANYCDTSNLISGVSSGGKGTVAGPFNSLTGRGWSPSNKLPVLTDNTSPAYSDANGGTVNVADGGVLAAGDANNEVIGAFVPITITP